MSANASREASGDKIGSKALAFGSGTPKENDRKRVRQTPSSIFAFHTFGSGETPTSKGSPKKTPKTTPNVTPKLRTVPAKNRKRCSSPFHASCSCPSIIESMNEKPAPFEATLRNYDVSSKSPKSAKSEESIVTPKSSIRDFPLPRKEETCAMTVAVRLRPFIAREVEEGEVSEVIEINHDLKSVRVINSPNELYNKLEFQFDNCFGKSKNSDQQSVYNDIGKHLLNAALDGYNACLFAYGQTGSGKSFSIMGTVDNPGIVPRFGEDLFKHVKVNGKNIVELSYFEIYNEKIHDLLSSESKKKGLKVREHPTIGPYVINLSSVAVSNFDQFRSWIALGNKRRITAATAVNDRSSRSHAICTINITQSSSSESFPDEEVTVLTSKVNIVDLAGSERTSSTNMTGDRLKEGININKSLLTLRKVITQLAERSSQSSSKNCFIPYRESVLTWLLKESLGSNSRTFMLATISPCVAHLDETVSTLRYACQSRKIVNVVRVNEDPKAVTIRKLLLEIDKLKEQQKEFLSLTHEKSTIEQKQHHLDELRLELEEMQKLLAEAKKSLSEKQMEAELKKSVEIQKLKEAGIEIDSNRSSSDGAESCDPSSTLTLGAEQPSSFDLCPKFPQEPVTPTPEYNHRPLNCPLSDFSVCPPVNTPIRKEKQPDQRSSFTLLSTVGKVSEKTAAEKEKQIEAITDIAKRMSWKASECAESYRSDFLSRVRTIFKDVLYEN